MPLRELELNSMAPNSRGGAGGQNLGYIVTKINIMYVYILTTMCQKAFMITTSVPHKG